MTNTISERFFSFFKCLFDLHNNITAAVDLQDSFRREGNVELDSKPGRMLDLLKCMPDSG